MQLEVTDIIAATAAAVAAVSAVASMVSAIASMRQVRLMREELDKRERPYIYGHFHAGRAGLIHFALENNGNVAAVNVGARFEEPAPTMHNSASLNTASLFKNAIAFFPPGASYSVPIDLGKNLLADGRPTEFQLNLTYETTGGRHIADMITFDISYMVSVLVPPPTTADVLDKFKRPVERISSVMESWRNEQWGAGHATQQGLGGDSGGEGVD